MALSNAASTNHAPLNHPLVLNERNSLEIIFRRALLWEICLVCTSVHGLRICSQFLLKIGSTAKAATVYLSSQGLCKANTLRDAVDVFITLAIIVNRNFTPGSVCSN